MNAGRIVGTAAVDAVAKAMEHIGDPATAQLVGVQITTVWKTTEGLRIVSQTVEAPKP